MERIGRRGAAFRFPRLRAIYGVHGAFRPIRTFAAAPSNARGRSPKRATPIDVARPGRRGFGTPKTLRPILGPERAHGRHVECNAPLPAGLALPRFLNQF